MEEAKLLNMIPEHLRQAFIDEIKEMLVEKSIDKVAEDKKAHEDIKLWAEQNNPKSKKP